MDHPASNIRSRARAKALAVSAQNARLARMRLMGFATFSLLLLLALGRLAGV